eukprot:TRINITY_DN2256_c0_g1_i2.p1 TRINITY_DN2256_c0_g1~~TRINITY_DN2256_c0_g1_i2.p1  ORF type:complete len:276 (-),score=38.58 TRINITY_DN2256_c0_g1_i2:1-828(-)
MVVKVGSKVSKELLNKEVIVNPSVSWGPSERVQSQGYQILGMPVDGTFADYIVTDADRVYPKPSHLSHDEAASLPLAGLTAYRALIVQGKLQSGQKLLVPSIGSGVSQFVAQFGVAAGAEVWVTSSSQEKINKAVQKLGVKGGAIYTENGWEKKLMKDAKGAFDVIVDGVGGNHFSNLVTLLLKPGGYYVTYGATAGIPKTFPVHNVFFQQKHIVGSTMGSDKDFRSMVDFVCEKKITPVIDSVYPFSQILDAIKKMEKGEQIGKIVIGIPKSKL